VPNIPSIAFVGGNANGILTWATMAVAKRAKLYGISMNIIDLTEKGWAEKLNACLAQERPHFCFAFQGFGMDLRLEAGNLWTTLGVPFISVMGDAPYYSPALHSAVGSGFFHLYACDDFQKTYLESMAGRNFSAVIQGFYPINPLADAIPWHDRELEIVYVKTGVDPERLRSQWSALPAKMRDVLEDSSTTALAGQVKSIAEIVAECYSERGIHFGERLTLFLRSCSMVDSYVRAVRAQRMLHEVMRHGGHVFGDWPHIEKTNTQARFHGPVPADKLSEVYSQSRILMNISPSTTNFVHERILAAFFAKAFSVSDRTAFVDEKLRHYPNFSSVSIDSTNLPDEMNACLSTIRKIGSDRSLPAQEMLEESRQRAEDEFSLDRLILEILSFVDFFNIERNSSFWTYPP
jgi:hypothetical protein